MTLECVDLSSGQKPQFTSQISALDGLKDGDSAHFECTLVPVGDPNLKVEWFHNGQPLRHSSRIKTVSDFGFVVLDIAYVQSHDTGEYVCKASNKFGEDFTKATLRCTGKSGVYLDSLQPDSLAKIRALEEQSGSAPTPQTPVWPSTPPAGDAEGITGLLHWNVGGKKDSQPLYTELRDGHLTCFSSKGSVSRLD